MPDKTKRQVEMKPRSGYVIVVGIVTAGFVGWQALETRRAAQATRDSVRHMERQVGIMDGQLTEAKESRDIQTKTLILQYRPKVIVRNATAKAFTAQLGERAQCIVAFQIVNTGGSPAHIVDGDIYLLPPDMMTLMPLKRRLHLERVRTWVSANEPCSRVKGRVSKPAWMGTLLMTLGG